MHIKINPLAPCDQSIRSFRPASLKIYPMMARSPPPRVFCLQLRSSYASSRAVFGRIWCDVEVMQPVVMFPTELGGHADKRN